MTCQIRRDKNNRIESVTAPNGKTSLLYNEVKKLVGNDSEEALKIWAKAYSPEFLYRYGDWVSQSNQNSNSVVESQLELIRDENGEPLPMYLGIPNLKFKNSNETERKIENFLNSIGVSIEYVDDLLPVDVAARADFINKMIHIARDKKEETTLPEEAAHFFVRLLPNDSVLRKEMFEQITSYPLYKKTLNDYASVYTNNGKPDFEKIKEEAIGKLIAQAILNPEGIHSERRRALQAVNWAHKILQYISALFDKGRYNPFIEASQRILESKVEGLDTNDSIREADIMYQLSSEITGEQVYARLLEENKRLKKVLSTEKDSESGKSKEIYQYNGKDVKNRVTDKVKAYYNKIFPGNVTKVKREYFNYLAEDGSNIHSDIEDITKRYLSADGRLLDVPQPILNSPKTSKEIYTLLESNISSRLKALVNQYGVDTRFLTELMIYDKALDTAGTIDLLIIKPNGRVDILDWKSSSINIKNFTVPFYKHNAYTIQLDAYEKILSGHGVEVDLKRAIPIRLIHGKNEADGKYTILQNLEIGDHNIASISQDKPYLLPIPSKNEKTGIQSADELIKKLEAIEDQLSNQKVAPMDRFGKIESLNNIRKAISDLQISHSLSGVIQTGELLISNIEKSLENDNLDISKAQLFFKQIRIYSDLAKTNDFLESEGFTDPLSDEEKGSIYRLSGIASRFEEKLKKFLLDKGNDIAGKVGVDPVTSVEKNPSWWASNIRSISGTATNAVRTFYKYLVSFQDAIYRSRDEVNKELTILKKELETWAKDKNIESRKIFDGILEFDEKGRWKGTFLNKYDKSFWQLKEKYLADKDVAGMEKILDLSENAKKRFEERQQSFLKWADNNVFSLDKQTDKKIRRKRIEDWNYQYNVFDPTFRSIALLNRSNLITGHPQYYSDKWKALQKEPVLLKVYNYFQGLLLKAEKLGIIEHQGHFIPNIAADKIDMWVQYGAGTILNLPGFFEQFEYKTGNTWGEIDPLTGKPLQVVPRLFQNNLATTRQDEQTGEDYQDFTLKSKDLFSVFSIWGKYTAEYEYMTKLEEVGTLMTLTETIKDQHLHRGSDGKYLPVKGNEHNINYLQDFIDYYVYSRKLKDGNPWEFELFGKTYSGKQMIQGAIRYMGMKTLAFNNISIAANFVGGKFNTMFSASKGQFFNKLQWAQGEFALSSDKGKALIDWFDVFLEDTSYHKAKQLSVYGAVKKLSYDNLFIGQRITDKLVQYPVLLAMTRSHGLIDGKIVNLQQHLRNKYDYENFYAKSIPDQKRITEDIEKELKILEDTKSIWSLATIKDGKLQIDGLSRDMETVMQFRQIVKRANKIILGNSTSDDIARYRMSILGQALGQFRNWMPAMLDERFSDLRYDTDSEAWTVGKIRSFYSNYFSTSPQGQNIAKTAMTLLSKHFAVLLKDLVGLTSVGDVQSRAKLLYAKAKAEAMANGLPFKITETEFIDLHLKNIKSTLNEMRLIIAFSALIISMAGHSDEDKVNKGLQRFITRTLDKFNNELMFYYNPINFTDLINSPIPVVSLATDAFKFIAHLGGETYGRITGQEKLTEKYNPSKYILKDIPISREIYNMGTIFNEDMRKSYKVTK